jgi:hypothetical protein
VDRGDRVVLSPDLRLRDERGAATTLGYALSLGITSLLVTGLLFTGGTFVEDQRDRAVRSELRVVGQQVADGVGSADRLAATTREGGAVELRRTLPDDVAGSGYRLSSSRLGDDDVRPVYELTLRSFDPEISTRVRVFSDAAVYAPRDVDGGDLIVQSNAALVPKLFVTEPDAAPVFVEADGVVALEAEGPTGTLAGSSDEADHYWEPFDDTDASGGTAVVTRPNVSVNPGDPGNAGETTTGPALTYDVEFDSAGTYYVFVRMKAPDGESDSVHVALNDETPVTYDDDGSPAFGLSEGAGSSWSWVHGLANDGDSGDYVTLSPDSPGVHNLRLYMREDGTQVDKIVLIRASSPPADPSDTGPSAF